MPKPPPESTEDFRPRIPYALAQPIYRLAGIGRRNPTAEVRLALECHIANNRSVLKRGPKLKKP